MMLLIRFIVVIYSRETKRIIGTRLLHSHLYLDVKVSRLFIVKVTPEKGEY